MRMSDQHPTEREIIAFLDGGLPEHDADAIREHCRACMSCSQILEEFSVVREKLDTLTATELRRPLWPAVQDSRRKSNLPILSPGFAAVTTAAVLAGVFFGALIGSVRDRPTKSEAQYLWSVVRPSITERGGDTLPDIYTITPSEEGRQ